LLNTRTPSKIYLIDKNIIWHYHISFFFILTHRNFLSRILKIIRTIVYFFSTSEFSLFTNSYYWYMVFMQQSPHNNNFKKRHAKRSLEVNKKTIFLWTICLSISFPNTSKCRTSCLIQSVDKDISYYIGYDEIWYVILLLIYLKKKLYSLRYLKKKLEK
jgi:hypothetical protein